ncbi:MAG: hypothetical protein JJU48_00365 [Methylophaga sp.]|nr:hypothetical protein [Methylophaga sp.]
MSDLIPGNYNEWHHCITKICRIPLTESYIRERISALNNEQDYMTSRFVELYGEEQRQQTLLWFEQALSEVT